MGPAPGSSQGCCSRPGSDRRSTPETTDTRHDEPGADPCPAADPVYAFPEDFVWGVAAASRRSRGRRGEDGKGESIWDRFAATPGKVKNGDTPEVACDHYHRYEARRRLDAGAGHRPLPALDRLAACLSRRGTGRSTRAGSTSTTG